MLIDDNQEMVRDMARRFAAEKLAPKAADWDRTGEFPKAEIAEMGALGLMGMLVPEEWDGAMSDHVAYALALEEIAGGDGAISTIMSVHNSVGCVPILRYGTDAQKASYLPKIADGTLIGSFALTEPETGSDAGSVRTSARRAGNVYVLNGTKRFITNAPEAGLFTVMARTNPEIAGAGGVSAFIVEAGTPGLSIGKPEHKMGQHGTHVADVIFEDCHIPVANLIGEREGQGFKTAMRVLDKGRLGIAAACVGFAERILGESIAYANDRIQFGKSIGEFQLVQAMIADSRTEIIAAKAMVLETARAKDAGHDVGVEASACKLFASEMVGRVADRNVQIHGGSGYVSDYPAERHYRDVRLYRIYEGTSEIQRLKIGRDTLRAARES